MTETVFNFQVTNIPWDASTSRSTHWLPRHTVDDNRMAGHVGNRNLRRGHQHSAL